MQPKIPGRLYLIPSLLGAAANLSDLPASTLAVVRRLDHFIVETPKQARAFLRHAGIALRERDRRLAVLDEHTPDDRLPELLAPALAGNDVGVLTDAGCPAVADPGARLARLAHARGVCVVPLVGPSAILLALMASGLGGQRFAFHGYLPVDSARRAAALRALEAEAHRYARTQIFIEAPYRNQRLLEAVLATCASDTLLCLATDLTLPTESIQSRRVGEWHRAPPQIDRRPTVFLLGGEVPGSHPGRAPRTKPRSRR